MKNIVVLGSSGSIGRQTLDVVRRHPDRLNVVGLAVHSSIDLLCDQIAEFKPRFVVVGNDELDGHERTNLWARLTDIRDEAGWQIGPEIAFGSDGIEDLCKQDGVDLVVNALVGAAGLRASYATLKAGRKLALANKESLVVGGDLLMPLSTHETLLPIDSEHGAIYQCLLGEKHEEVNKLWVTASGGPFRGRTCEELKDVNVEQALAHPTWHMGPKITIDSSTLMNKGLEVIEAHHLFAMPYDRIEVVVQPQSAIHSMVEYVDGSVKAHLGTTDMRIPIQFALSYPERWDAPVEPLDFRTLGALEFYAPDTDTFRCLALARAAGETGGTLPAAMNAANEVAVASFLAGECAFLQIAQVVESVMEQTEACPVESIEQLQEVDALARKQARAFLDAAAR
ncbi:MAG: 1-deoxy-D-xylulose-5-phosphate reductoisomerase [Eggerthellaceae bacterium]